MLEEFIFSTENVISKIGILSPLFFILVIIYYFFLWRSQRFKGLLKKVTSLLESIFEWTGVIIAKFLVYILPLIIVAAVLIAQLMRFLWYRT